MQSDITRKISASVYLNASWRDFFFNFAKDRYQAIVESPGLDTQELLKHVLNARREERTYYQRLFFPSIIFWCFFIIAIATGGAILNNGVYIIIAIIAFFASYAIVLLYDVQKNSFLQKNLTKDSYNPSFNYEKSDINLLSAYQKRAGGNVVFYSGYSPFVGCGVDIGGWSFVVDLDKGKKVLDKRLNPLNFEESELYSAISDEIRGLNMPNLSITDKVFINGKKIRNNRELLPNILGHPINNVSDNYMLSVMNNDSKDARFYKVIQIIDWDGDLILTSFLRVQKNEKSIFIENNFCLLPPIGSNFEEIDKIKQYSGIKHFISWATGLIFITIGHTLLSIVKIISNIGEAISNVFGGKEVVKQKIVKSSPDYDYGAYTSLRGSASQQYYSQHFQKLDQERYFKIIEKRIFNLITDFLDNKNIDTSEFKEREASILNQGVIMTGGNLTGENIAIGKDSKIKTKNK